MAKQTSKGMTLKVGSSTARTETVLTDTGCDMIPVNGPFGNRTIGPRTVIVPANPIIWDEATSYEYLTLVASENFARGYLSVKDVPAGTPLSNSEYWVPVADYNAQLRDIQSTLDNLQALVDALNDNKVVRPEDYGAVGDGTTDDTAAFTAALKTGQYVLCNGSKNYYFASTIDLSEQNYFYLDGGGCTFTNMSLRVNLEHQNGAYTWRLAYAAPRSFVKNAYFIGNQPALPVFYTGCPIKFENVVGRNVAMPLLAIPPSVYMDFMQFNNATMYNCFTSIPLMCVSWNGVSSVGEDAISQGDQWVFDSVHFAEGGDSYPCACIKSSGQVYFKNCLNVGVRLYNANGIFDNCHIEYFNGTTAGTSAMYFNNCEFSNNVDMATLQDMNATFTNCSFLVYGHQPFKGVASAAYNLGNRFYGCKGVCFGGSGSALSATPAVCGVFSEAPSAVNFSQESYSDDITYTKVAAQTAMPSGNRHYEITPSVSSTIIYGIPHTGKRTFDINADSGDAIIFNLPYNNCYVHVSVNVAGTIYKCVTYVTNSRIIDSGININASAYEAGSTVDNPSVISVARLYGIVYVGNQSFTLPGDGIVANKTSHAVGYQTVS